MKHTITLSLFAASLLTTASFAQEDLGEITVTTENKAPQSLQNITSDVDVITAKEIEERGYITVTEALNSLPGISFTSNGGLGKSTSVYVRGMDNKRVLILVDGIRYQDPSNTNGAAIQHLMITDIDRIEVIKGAQSGVWGADAAAGVINIITKSATKGNHASANIEAGSFNTKRYSVNVSKKTDTYDILLSAYKITSDGFTTKAPFGENIDNMEDDGYTNRTITAKLGINVTDNSRLEIVHTNIEGSTDFDRRDENDTEAQSDFTTKLTSISYTYNIGNHSLKLKHEISSFEREEKNITPSPWFTQVEKFDGKVINTEMTDNFNYREKDIVVLGLSHQKTEADYTTASGKSDNSTFVNKALFVTNSNHIGKNIILTEAIRYDRYNNFENKTTGKIGFQYTSDIGLIVTGNYGTAYNAPNIIQMLNPWGASNNNLQPETIKSYDLSVGYGGLKLTYFNQKIDNMISWFDPGTPFNFNDDYYKNLSGTSRINGIEIVYRKTFFDNLVLDTSYTKLTKAEDKDHNKLLRRARENFKIALDYYAMDNLHIGVDAQYVGQRTDKAFNPITFKPYDVETGKYTVINLTANYDITPHLEIYGKIENIGDKYYQTVYGYATSPRAFYFGIRGKI